MARQDGRFLCDVCEEPFDAERTVNVTLEGRAVEVDLCAPHVRKLDMVLAQFLDGSRPATAEP